MNKIRVSCSGSNDNICEKVSPKTYEVDGEVLKTGDCDCEKCDNGCSEDNEYFSINDCGDYFTLSYHKKIGDVIIDRHSEKIDKTTLKEIRLGCK